MNTALKTASRQALGRFNPLGLMVTQQADIMRSKRATTGHLVIHEPTYLEAKGTEFSVLHYDADDTTRTETEVPEGMYSLTIQCIIHHKDRVAGFIKNEVRMSFTHPVNYHPIHLIDDMRRHLVQELSTSLDAPLSLTLMNAPYLEPVFLYGNEAEGLIHGHLHQDEINQSVILSVPLLLEGNIPDTLTTGRTSLVFQEDIDWLADHDTPLAPAFRDYLMACDSAAFEEEAVAQ